MSKYRFNLKNLEKDPFGFYLAAAQVNRDCFQKNLLAFQYVQISSYEGMKSLFRHPGLTKPTSYKKIGEAYKLSGSLINDGPSWQLARSSSQKSLLDFTEAEIFEIVETVFPSFAKEILLNPNDDLLPVFRVFVQSCINLLFFKKFDWQLNSSISARVRELEEVMFAQQWSPLFQIFGTNFYFLMTKHKRKELERLFQENFNCISHDCRFNNWKNTLNDQELPKDFVFKEIFNFWVAANEATSNTICWSLQLLSEFKKENPSTEITYPMIEGSLKEAQRVYPAAYFIAREATQDIDFGEYKIKKKSIVNFSTYAMNRNTENFDNPHKVDFFKNYKGLKTDKPPYSFGHGKRVCSGRSLAESLMPYFINLVLEKFELHPTDHKPLPLAHVSLTSANGFKFKLKLK